MRIVQQLGHTLHDTYPALTPLTAEPPVHAPLAGVSLTVTLRAPQPRGELCTTGGFLFTHRGYSGPSVLDVSHVAVLSRRAGGERAAGARAVDGATTPPPGTACCAAAGAPRRAPPCAARSPLAWPTR
jgi:hypothetical protein